jgi:hypothetical protein
MWTIRRYADTEIVVRRTNKIVGLEIIPGMWNQTHVYMVGLYNANMPTSSIRILSKVMLKKIPWLWSASKIYLPSDRRLLAK